MTINEQKEEISKILKKHFNWNGREWILDEQGIDEGASTDDFDDFVADLSEYISENYQPKTTSMDIEDIVKKYGNFVHPYVKGKCLAFYLLNHTDYEKYIHNRNYYKKGEQWIKE